MSFLYIGCDQTSKKQEKLIDTQIIVIFCLCEDMLRSLHHHEDVQRKMSDAEVMTTALVAVLYFRGNFLMASRFMYDMGYVPNMLSKSRFNRRLHAISELFLTLFLRLGETWKKLNEHSTYVLDSFPIPVCDNYRIRRSKIVQGEEWRGYIPSKKRFFYGVRVHVLVTEYGEPVEFFLMPGSFSDTSALRLYDFDLPEKSWIIGDKAYNDYLIEDVMRESGLELVPLRKKNSHRKVPPHFCYLQSTIRKVVETTGSLIERLLPKSIHAVTAKGFDLKVALFVVAISINKLW